MCTKELRSLYRNSNEGGLSKWTSHTRTRRPLYWHSTNIPQSLDSHRDSLSQQSDQIRFCLVRNSIGPSRVPWGTPLYRSLSHITLRGTYRLIAGGPGFNLINRRCKRRKHIHAGLKIIFPSTDGKRRRQGHLEVTAAGAQVTEIHPSYKSMLSTFLRIFPAGFRTIVWYHFPPFPPLTTAYRISLSWCDDCRVSATQPGYLHGQFAANVCVW